MKSSTREAHLAQRARAFFFATVLLAILSSASAKSWQNPLLQNGLYKRSKFQRIGEFSDEFSGRFDKEMWYDNNPRWLGRQPGLFASKNVQQKNGKLFLLGRYEQDDEAFKDAPEGYEKYTTAYMQTKKNAKYGYFEVKAKPSNSRLSSSFWGSLDTPDLWTEIDVFELGGGAINDNGVDFRKRVNMNLHVFRDKKKGIKRGENEISKPAFYTHRSYLRSRFHTYGLDWSKKWITWTFNGRAIRRDRNEYWHQAFPIKFDVETMPHWFGLPSRKTLPAVYKIKYIRAWRRTRKDSGQVVRSAGRLVWPLPIALPMSLPAALPSGSDNPGPIALPSGNGNMNQGGIEDDNIDEDEEEAEDEDEALLEVHSESEIETDAPRDGLQRPPITGSNERVYQAVIPLTGGRRWTQYIAAVNAKLNDVEGALIDADEKINIEDFDGEVLMMRDGQD